MLASYISNWHSRAVIWGPNGQLDYEHYIRLVPGVLVAFVPNSDRATNILLISAIAIAIVYAVGLCPAMFSWLFALSSYIMISRERLDFDGGCNLLLLLAFLLCFTDSSRHLNIFRSFTTKESDLMRPIRNMIHNSAYFLINWQICMVYTWAAFYKLGGTEWRDGTALYYILQSEHFRLIEPFSRYIAHNLILVAALNYLTLAFQIAFPLLMWNKQLKPYLVSTGIALHIGIATTMGLLSFSLTMVAADLSLLSDRQWFAFRALPERFSRLVGIRFTHFSLVNQLEDGTLNA
jgi:antimicrobial peptide system SdpB family protein